MRITVEHQRELHTTFGTPRTRGALVSIDFKIVCPWATLGLVMTALGFTLGFGADVVQALARAE
jgi:hypothetical protein